MRGVTRRAYGAGQFVRTDHRRDVAHTRTLSSQVNHSLQHSGLLSECTLYAAHTGSAGHALHHKINLIGHRCVAGLADRLGDAGGIELLWVEKHLGALGRQVHAGRGDAGQFAQRPFHPRATRGTGHPVYANLKVSTGFVIHEYISSGDTRCVQWITS